MYFFYPNWQLIQPNLMILTPIIVQPLKFSNFIESHENLPPHQNPSQINKNINDQQYTINIKTQQSLKQFPTQFTIKTKSIISSQHILSNKEQFSIQQEKQVNSQLDQYKKKKSLNELFFGIQWKNQNRNIIPNIMNQMISYIQKKNKSQLITNKIFQSQPHLQQWTINKYYCYVKKIKSKMGNYINENQLQTLTKIQQPQFIIFSKPQQQFYLKVCRIVIEYFLKNQSILISLTSKRMSQQKRKGHLIAKRALLLRFKQLLNIDQ